MDDKISVLYIYTLYLLSDRHNFFKFVYSGLFIYNMYRFIRKKSFFTKKTFPLYILIYILSYLLIQDPNPFYHLLTFYLPSPNFFRAIFIIIFNTYIFNEYILEPNKKDIIIDENIDKENDEKEKNKETINKVEKEEKVIKDNEEEKKEAEEKKEKEEKEKEEKEKKDKKEKKEENKNNYFLSNEIRYLWSDKTTFLYFMIFLILIKVGIYYYHTKYWTEITNKQNLLALTKKNDKNTVYYICSVVYNIEPMIKDWLEEMKKLIDYLGPENVIVSIYENGDSTDKTKKYLNFFENYLLNNKVSNSIIRDRVEQKEGLDHRKYLAKLRNRALDFLYQNKNLDFSNTKIIFFNEIIYRYEDIVKLVFTNDGNYDAACGMDFNDKFYVAKNSKELDGKRFGRYFPYMHNKESQDAYINGEPIRVSSCWSGVSVLNAKAFEDRNKLFFRTEENQSECSLLNADMYKMGYRKILINTQVVVSYDNNYYNQNQYIYPWTRDLFTYFYYYFKYGFSRRNYNLTNLQD